MSCSFCEATRRVASLAMERGVTLARARIEELARRVMGERYEDSERIISEELNRGNESAVTPKPSTRPWVKASGR